MQDSATALPVTELPAIIAQKIEVSNFILLLEHAQIPLLFSNFTSTVILLLLPLYYDFKKILHRITSNFITNNYLSE